MTRAWNAFERFVVYGLVGFAAEVCFTATWEAVEHGNRKLIGVTSMYVFIVYGVSLLVMERIFLRLKDSVVLPLRAVVYVMWCYSWEFSTGTFLKQFHACPWDYAAYFHNHYMGVITAEYIPVWYIAAMFAEKLVIKNALQAGWREPSHHHKHH